LQIPTTAADKWHLRLTVSLPKRRENVALDQQPRPFGLSDLNVVEILLHLFGIGDASDGRAGLARIVLWPLSL